MKNLRVVLDTNVLVLAFEAELEGPRADFYRQTAARVVAFVFNRKAAYLTADTLTEFGQVVEGRRFRERHPGQDEASQRFYDRVREQGRMVGPGRSASRCWQDESDTKFLHAVAGAEAAYLVTEDHHLLAIQSSDGARILRIRDFANDVMGVCLERDPPPKPERRVSAAPPKQAFEKVAPPKVVRDAYGRPKKQKPAPASEVRISPSRR